MKLHTTDSQLPPDCAAASPGRNSVRAQLPKLTERQALGARQRLLDGESPKAVAAHLRVGMTTLYATFKRYNIATPNTLNPSHTADILRARHADAKARGLKFGRSYALTRAQAIAAHQRLVEGESVSSLARSLGIRAMTLRAALRRHRLKRPSPKLTEDQIARANRKLAQGETIAATAHAFGLWPITLINTLRRHELAQAAFVQSPTGADL